MNKRKVQDRRKVERRAGKRGVTVRIEDKEPETVKRIRRCFRCGRKPGYATWEICADANRLRIICIACDIKLNRMVLRWARDPQWKLKIIRYARRLKGA